MATQSTVQVTEEAIAHAAFQLREAGEAEGAAIRLSAYESGRVLRTGRVEPDDVIFDHDGRPVIDVSKAMVE